MPTSTSSSPSSCETVVLPIAIPALRPVVALRGAVARVCPRLDKLPGCLVEHEGRRPQEVLHFEQNVKVAARHRRHVARRVVNAREPLRVREQIRHLRPHVARIVRPVERRPPQLKRVGDVNRVELVSERIDRGLDDSVVVTVVGVPKVDRRRSARQRPRRDAEGRAIPSPRSREPPDLVPVVGEELRARRRCG